MSYSLSRPDLDQRANLYVSAQFDDSTSFSKLVRTSVDTHSGQAWTLLPEGVSEERVYRFTEAEFLPVNTKRRLERIGSMVAVASLKSEQAKHIQNFMQESGSNACVLLEHPMLKPGEDQRLIQDMKFDLDDVVCILLNDETAAEDIQLAIDVCSVPWRGVAAFCIPDRRCSRNDLKHSNDLRECLRFVRKLSSIAYDGEGYITVDLL